MDTITHGIAGALIAKAFFTDDAAAGAPRWSERPRNGDRVAIICATMGAMFPDVDVFFIPFSKDPLAFLTLHRGVTHSLLMLLVWSGGLALLAGWLAQLAKWPAPSYAQLYSIFCVALASHIFLDLLTSWGTMVWSPLDHTRLAWDALFIIDLMLSGALLVPQLAAWLHGPRRHPVWLVVAVWLALSAALFAVSAWARTMAIPFSTEGAISGSVVIGAFLLVPLRHRGKSRFGRTTWARIGLTVAAGYIGFAAGMHAIALGQVHEYADGGHINYEGIAAIPMPPFATHWAGLIATQQNLYRIQFDLLGGEPPRLDIYRTATSNAFVTQARELPDVQTFLWFARFPIFAVQARDGNTVVRITDARFFRTARTAAGENPGQPPSNFTYQVVFGPDGGVKSSGLLPDN